jgi:hypothetical protein
MTLGPRVTDGLEKRTSGFDFLIGEWKVANHRLKEPLSGTEDWYEAAATAWSTTMHNGAISVDEMWYPELGSAGASIRVYTHEDQNWTIYWVNSNTGHLQPPVRGTWSEDGSRFVATGEDEFDGRPTLARYLWHSITPDSAIWEQAFSLDHGKSWETNWIMTWTPCLTTGSRPAGPDRLLPVAAEQYGL